jgi:putative SOS response-associated peptidase YedK
VLEGFRWGLLPQWAKDIKVGYTMINARAETLTEKPAYRNLIVQNRIAVISDGFYEWKQEKDGKQPFRFQLKSKSLFGFAGLYSEWKDNEGKIIPTCTIITSKPNSLIEDVHDRMPIILNRSGLDVWLDPAVKDKELILSLLKPYPASKMIKYPVSRAVGKVSNVDPELINEIPLNSK